MDIDSQATSGKKNSGDWESDYGDGFKNDNKPYNPRFDVPMPDPPKEPKKFTETLTINIPNYLLKKVQEYVSTSQYADISEYIRYLLEEDWKKKNLPDLDKFKPIKK